MSLPKCVKINLGNIASAEALQADGWRKIGVLDHYSGQVTGRLSNVCPTTKKHTDPPDVHQINFVIENVPKYGFSGRLWRDPEIPISVAIEETGKFILSESRHLMVADSGFCLVSARGEFLRIDLVGSLLKGNGTAEKIIRHAVNIYSRKNVVAGTYSDNIAARSLYLKLGLKLSRSEEVYHK